MDSEGAALHAVVLHHPNLCKTEQNLDVKY